jgi:hypothetical protein
MASNVRRSAFVASALIVLVGCGEQSFLQNPHRKSAHDHGMLASVTVNGLSFDRVIVDPNSPENPYAKNIARLDGDGLPDLIVSGGQGPAVWYQAPNWIKRTISTTAFSQSGSATGDIDLDGDMDIVIGPTWYENGSAGSSWTPHNLPGGSAGTHDIVVADVNADGKPDIIMRGESATVVTIYLQTNPNAWVPFDVQPGVGLNGLDVADVNGDGRPDIVVGGVWMENPGGNVASSSWTTHVYASWNEYASVKVIDLDKDGRMDIVLSVSEHVGKLSWFKGPADPENGTWTERVIDTGLAKVHCFAVEDVNGDGNLDVIASEFEGAGRLIVYLAAGTSWTPSELGRDSLHNMRAGDIDADGDIDFFGTYCFGIRPVLLYRNTGGGGPGNAPPTVQNSASAAPSTVTGSTTALSVLGNDDGGESSLGYTWATVGTPPAGVTFSPNGSNSAKNSTATFSRAGSYQLRVTIADVQGATVTSDVAVTVSQTLTGILVTPSTATVAPSATQAFSATGADQFGQAMGSSPSITWSVSGGGSISASGVFSAGSTAGGPFVVTASSGGGITGNASVTVTTGGGGATATFGETNVLSLDDGGNGNLLVAQQAALAQAGTVQSLSFYVVTPSGKLRLGIYDATGPSGGPGAKLAETAELTPVAGWNTAAVVTPVALAAGNYWLAYLSNTNSLSFRMATNGSGRWYSVSYGVMPATFSTSPSAGAYHWSFYATIGTGDPPPPSNQAPTVAIAAGANPGSVNASTSALSVLGADDAGEANLRYTWATTGNPPAAVTFSPNGTNAAKNSTATFSRAGSYQLTVVVADAQGLTVTSNVTVTVNQTLTSVVVTPVSATVAPSATQAFAATARDQFSQAMSPTPTFTWTVSGGGSISTAGVFTAGGASGGPFTVTASTGDKSGTASVTITGGGGGTPVNIGETNILSLDDGRNGGLLVAMQADLSQARTIQSLSFYVTTAAGNLRLGIYDATGPNGGPGVKRAETAEFTPTVGWNTRVVETPVLLPAGTYWLAYFSNTDLLQFRMMTNGNARWYSTTYGVMPNTYSTNPQSGAYHWSFYATMQ